MIEDAQDEPTTILVDTHPHRAASRSKLDGVIQQVDDDLLEATGIA